MGAPLDKSHPDIVKEIRRLANEGKKPAEIKVAIKEKFNYTTSYKAINNWAGVDFDTKSGRLLTPEKVEEIRVLMSGDSPPTNKEAVKILGVSEQSIQKHKGNVAKYLTAEQWAEKYPDMRDNLLSNDKETVRKARDAAHQRRQREVLAAIKKAAANVSFDPLTDKQMRQLAEDKAASVLKNQKIRALKYRIGPIGGGPSSYISYADYRKLEKKPKILGRHYQGTFSTDSVRAMKKTYADKVYAFLKSGGNPNLIPFEFGHILPMKGVGMSGLTNIHNVQIQDVDFNRQQSNKVTNKLLRGLGYHAPKLPGFLGLILGGVLAPWEKILADPLQEGVKYAAEVTTGLDVDKAIADPRRLRPSRIGATIAEDIIVPLGQMIAGGPPEVGANARGIPSGRFGPARRGLLDTEERQKRKPNIWT